MIGAGIVGTASAFELAQDGHDVVVLDRRSSVAAEASFASGGLMSPGALLGWGGPGKARRWLGGLLARDSDTLHRPLFEPSQWRSLWRLGRRTPPPPARAALLRLAAYSQERLALLRGRWQLEFERSDGLLVLWRDDRERARWQPALAALHEIGSPAREVDPASCYAIEPGLERSRPLVGGIHLPQAESANGRQLAQLLRDAAETAGVDFRFATVVHSIDTGADGCRLRVEQMALSTGFGSTRMASPDQPALREGMVRRARAAARYLAPVSDERFDAVVIAAGAASARWLPALSVRTALLPVYGYSLTAPLRAPDRGPRAAVIDTRRQLSIGRLGQRVRVAGGAEFGGHATQQHARLVQPLYDALNEWFPGCAHLARPQVWKGRRPMLARDLPLIGASARPGIWLNLGHGNGGLALACGSARLLADQIGGRTPAVDPAAYGLPAA